MNEQDVIEKFVIEYSREVDFYQEAARLCRVRCEDFLRTRGILGIVSHRAKSSITLEEKLRKRNPRGGYKSTEQIRDDIPDLAGVRIALYFPDDREKVISLLKEAFFVHKEKSFPEKRIRTKNAVQKIFDGYHATHLRISMRSEDLDDLSKRFSNARVEIQVGSLLMHAWAEVEHDLIYKPKNGSVSIEEHEILDEINGLVLAGEIALKRLQQAVKNRISKDGQKFAHQYELASWLYSQASINGSAQLQDMPMGRLDILFKLIREARIDTVNLILPYVDQVRDFGETRPIADQVSELILDVHPNLYEFYIKITEKDFESEASHQSLGQFIENWIKVESILSRLVEQQRELDQPSFFPHEGGRSKFVSTLVDKTRFLQKYGIIDDKLAQALNYARRERNGILHGVRTPDATFLRELNKITSDILVELDRKYEGRKNF